MARILIANRGEIAIRVIDACRELGHTSIVAYSDADQSSLPVRLANEAVRIGPGPASQSYLDQHRVGQAALQVHADAVHPGYGFLSESASFARLLEESGIVWIGPSPRVIDLMGDKSSAREAAARAGVPLVPGSGVLETLQEAQKAADQIGYPVLVKASAGGGGKGIREVSDSAEMELAFSDARREVEAAFGDPSLYLEKSLRNVRHIEVQVLADSFSNTLHLYERDCSIQRRRQKLVEEAPAPKLPAEIREKMCLAAVKLAEGVAYQSAGTVEFLVDESYNFYFIEMNTRIQVEHGISELVTGIDLVKEQINIALGLPVSLRQNDIHPNGYAIEARINAENPMLNFLGSPGEITYCHLPSGPDIRVDSYIESGAVVQPFYDSLIAKVMSYGPDRETAIKNLKNALSELDVRGIHTTTAYINDLISEKWFEDAEYNTNVISA